jgi:FkbM family methyltransferase
MKIKFNKSSSISNWRFETLYTKEPGTVDLLKKNLQPGDVFFDIGANVGIYSILAATLVNCQVYSFEPHIINALELMKNVRLNSLEDRVKVLTLALNDVETLLDFNYASEEPGSSGSQLGHTRNELGADFSPVLSEMKLTTSLDDLVLLKRILPQPNIIKIDVDGNDLKILQGMDSIMSFMSLRIVQVEIHPDNNKHIVEYMRQHDFKLYKRHASSLAQKKIDAGSDIEEVFHNAVFTRDIP